MTETAIPEDIREKATRFAGEYLAHDVSCERLYRDVAALLMAERERCALVAQHLNGWGADCGKGGHAEHIATAIRNQR